MTPPRDPLLGIAYAAACLALSVRVRTAHWRARCWAAVAEGAVTRARAALADAEAVDR